jgi:hypothetical protein
MGLLPFFKKDDSQKEKANNVGTLLVQVGLHECKTFQQAWSREFDEKTEVALFAEIAIVLISALDRLAFKNLKEPERSKIMNQIVNKVRDSFTVQSYFGDTRQERLTYFENLFANRIPMFASCSSIMGEERDSLLFTGSIHLTEMFLDDFPEPQRADAVLETGKSLPTTFLALLTIKDIKSLLKIK